MFNNSNKIKNSKIPIECQDESLINPNLFYNKSEIAVESVENGFKEINLYAQSTQDYGICPYCHSKSNKVHSRYMRRIVDLPILGKTVVLYIEVRKFFCQNEECHRKTFAEQPGNEIFRYRRRTRRCECMVMQHGLSTSSNIASKLLDACGIQISSSTVLRDIHRLNIPKYENVRRVGVDDWAYRKGVTYGSIVVNLETGSVIDILEDRERESFEQWLSCHKEVTMVSRDRSTDYSAAIKSTNPEIKEVADLFHLVKNMSDCVTKVIGDHYSEYRAAIRPEEKQNLSNTDRLIGVVTNNSSRQAKFDSVKNLQSEGKKIYEIADELGIARQTVRKYMKISQLSPRKGFARNPYHKYDSYVETEYEKGKAMKTILQEIRDMGFKGSKTPFYDHYKYLLDGHRGCRSKEAIKKMEMNYVKQSEPLIPIRAISYSVEKYIRGKELDDKERKLVKTLSVFDWFSQITSAASSFLTAMRCESKDALMEWITTYNNTSIHQLNTFIKGIQIDINAVINCIYYKNVSNGIVEGFVNKLKEEKRVMYGRAKIELLRRKMILPSICFN